MQYIIENLGYARKRKTKKFMPKNKHTTTIVRFCNSIYLNNAIEKGKHIIYNDELNY